MTENPLYLPGLNGLRALAASAVIYSHVSSALPAMGLPAFPSSNLAGFGVTIFFALSGFLITYLLMVEGDRTGSVAVGRFYVRRTLRIWPLYFFYLGLILVLTRVLEGSVDVGSLGYFLLFLPNVPYVFGGALEHASHYWSLGVEEQFYLFWPWFVLLSRGRLLRNMLLMTAVFLAAKVFLNLHYGSYSPEYTLIYVTRFDCMALGGMGAWLHLRRPGLSARLARSWIQWVAWSLVALTALNRFHLVSIVDHEIMAAATVVLISGQIIPGSGSPISLETPVMGYLGRLSFGLYVYHPAVFFLLRHASPGEGGGWPATVAWYLAVFGLTVAVAHLSYKWLEKPFLRLKDRFAIVHSAVAAEGRVD